MSKDIIFSTELIQNILYLWSFYYEGFNAKLPNGTKSNETYSYT